MIEKLKAFGDAVKEAVLWVLLPLIFVAGYIYYLLSQNSELKDEVNEAKGEQKLNELQGEQKRVDSAATDSNADYGLLRSAYLRSRNSGSGQSPSGQGPTSKDSGPGDGSGTGNAAS